MPNRKLGKYFTDVTSDTFQYDLIYSAYDYDTGYNNIICDYYVCFTYAFTKTYCRPIAKYV